MNKKTRAPLILLGLALGFLLVAFLLSRGSAQVKTPDAGPAVAQAKPVVFPRYQIHKKPTGPLADAQVTPEKRKQTLDAMQRALLPPGGQGAVFVEVNAIRHTPLMEKILKCRQAEMLDGLSQMKEELGVDPMEDLDRVGVMPNVVAASGYFENLKVPDELGGGAKYGKDSTIWQAKGDDGETIFLGQVGDSLLMTSSDEAALKAAIDRADGTGPVGEPLDPNLSKAEMYGTLDGSLAKEILGSSPSPEAQRVANAIASSTMRMNVDDNVAASFDIVGKTPEEGEQLQKALTAALALGRARAMQEGETELAQLLDQAMVQQAEDGAFGLDIAVPGEVLLETMGCGADGTPKNVLAPAAAARDGGP